MNRLSEEKSAYLKHAANQKIDWYPWSEKAFDEARQGDRPVFLSSGAVWCHWCHVMAQECFFDDEISGLLNDHFINIKLDRDERPDIDRRYQMAVAAMGQGGGWPLSMFLTPDKAPFFGGTYFPPEDRHGRPGFKKILKAVIELYKSKQDEISQYTGRLMNALTASPEPAGEISKAHLDKAVKDILSNFDTHNGGFGTAPKFPMSGAMDFLINRYYFTGDEATGNAVRKTLEAMARGGFYDQVGGGFHRYSTDEAWRIPHFEKMADDNAWLLRNYLSAYAVFGDEFYKEIAVGIITFLRDVLSDPEGGFYTSQDADVTPDDEGGYFTWTDAEMKSVLTDEEHKLISLHLIHEAGSMHHDKSKKVLFQVVSAAAIAEETGRPVTEVLDIIKSGKEKMLRARNSREAPFIDRTLYTSINGMLISVFLYGFRVLDDNELKDFAIKSLDRILALRLINNELYHTDNVSALLDDYAYLTDALLAAYEVTGDSAYITKAEALMKTCLDKLWAGDEGGFFDTA
ncbi:MAG: thioredoxin domain-containing protein, partial [Nitrospirae bacterium]|nr:thioredoxin domain-containing protein [Nitrospirota bacterium]